MFSMSSVNLLVVVVTVMAAVVLRPAAGRPQFGGGNSDGSATILRDERTGSGDGNYQFMFETSNGIFRQEQGTENNGIEQTGGWSYTSPEGVPVEITFVSNAGGFQPVGALIPIAPELPYQRTQVY